MRFDTRDLSKGGENFWGDTVDEEVWSSCRVLSPSTGHSHVGFERPEKQHSVFSNMDFQVLEKFRSPPKNVGRNMKNTSPKT